MSTKNIQFADETQSVVIAAFGCPQDPAEYPNQGQLAEDDPRYLAFLHPVYVPASVTMRQARLALLASGKLANVAPAIAALPSPEKEKAQIEWEYAATVDRDSSLTQTLGVALGLDDEQLDSLFVEAVAL